MHFLRTTLFILAIIAVPVSAAALPIIDIEGAVGVWRTSPSGTVAYEPGVAGDYLDLESDLSYDDETEIFGRLKLDMPFFIPNIYLMANPMEFEDTGRKGVEFTFGDHDFAADVDFDSKLVLDNYDIGLFYSVPLLKTASLYTLNVEGGINVRIIDAEAQINQGALMESEKETFFIPMVYLGVQFRPTDRFSIEAEGRGIAYDNDTIISLIGRLKYKMFGPWFIAGGYRYDDYDVDLGDDFIIDAEISGPFAETGFSF